MPYYDQTGPRGEGSMTGRGHGRCSGGRSQAVGYEYSGGHHRGRGCGRGYGRGYDRHANWTPDFNETDSERLAREKKFLQKRLAAIEEQLNED